VLWTMLAETLQIEGLLVFERTGSGSFSFQCRKAHCMESRVKVLIRKRPLSSLHSIPMSNLIVPGPCHGRVDNLTLGRRTSRRDVNQILVPYRMTRPASSRHTSSDTTHPSVTLEQV
jgi:hypothetical protein